MKLKANKTRRILFVDGYNVINAEHVVRDRAALEDSRHRLNERLHDYAAASGQEVTLVYDAWLGDRPQRSIEKRDKLTIVYTMKGETADRCIERMCDALSEDISLRRCEVRVATSDFVEQTVAFGRGAVRISSRELLLEMQTEQARHTDSAQLHQKPRFSVMDRLPEETRRKLEELRRG